MDEFYWTGNPIKGCNFIGRFPMNPENKKYVISEEVKKELLSKSAEVRKNAYCIYSKFHVGAAILADDDKIYIGANVENLSFGLTICAERAASFNMISTGGPNRKIKAVAVTTSNGTTPCGACRQVLLEFTNPNQDKVPIFIQNSTTGEYRETTLGELIPQVAVIQEDASV